MVGGGITGLTTALLLGRAGRSVALLEADHVGVGTTGGSTAKVSLLQGTQLSQIARRHSDDVVQQYVAGQRRGPGLGRAILRRPRACPSSTGRRTPSRPRASGARAARRECDVARRAGLPVTWLDRLDLPFDTHGGVRLAGPAAARPAGADRRAVAAGRGARRTHRRAGARAQGHGPRAGRASSPTSATRAPAPWCSRRTCRSWTGAASSRASSRRGPTASPSARRSRSWTGCTCRRISRAARCATPRDPDGPLLLVGGNGHTTGRGGSEAARLDELRAWTAEHFPEAEETHAWSAQDYVPHHALPYAGPLLPGSDDLLVAGGYSKWGMTNGVAAALALSGRILGGHMEWAEVFEPWHSHELRGLVDAARVQRRGRRRDDHGLAPAAAAARLRAGGRRGRRLRPAGPPRHADGGLARQRLRAPGRRPCAPTSAASCAGTTPSTAGTARCTAARFGQDGEVLEGPATCGLARR